MNYHVCYCYYYYYHYHYVFVHTICKRMCNMYRFGLLKKQRSFCMSSLFGGTFLLCPKVVMFIVRFSEACEKLKFKGWICEECQQGQRPVQPEGWIRMGILDYGDQWWEYTARTLCAKMLWEWPDNSGTGWTLELYRGLSFWRPIDANWDGFCFQCSVQPFFLQV